METRPHYNANKYNFSAAEDELDECTALCPTDPDLLLIRKNAIDEREAIALYLTAASKTSGPLSQLFIDTARDEMTHFRKLMILLAKYDPAQAEAFDELKINLAGNDFRKNHAPNYCPQDRLEIIDLLTKAITSELAAINMYQESYDTASHDDVKALFCKISNDEKLHVAAFWKALMVFTKESVVTS